MKFCPTDGARGRTLETRQIPEGTRRRYECLKCARRWSTVESLVRTGRNPKTEHLAPADREDLLAAVRALERLLENGLAPIRPRSRRRRPGPPSVDLPT